MLGGQNVAGVDTEDGLAIGRPAVHRHAHGLGLAGALPQGAHGAGVAEMRAALRVETDAGEGSGVLGVGIEMEGSPHDLFKIVR